MAGESDDTRRPFPVNKHGLKPMLSSSDVEALCDWLKKYGMKSAVIGGEYTVGELIDDLESIESGIWNDAIDAMGEDA